MNSEEIFGKLNISEKTINLVNECESIVKENFAKIDAISEYNEYKVIAAFQKNQVSEACLVETTGYGYNDIGRDTLECVYADVFKTDEALVRSQIVCGTHALFIAASSNTRPGDVIYSPCGMPYDTFQTVLGLNGAEGSLKDYNVDFAYTPLKADGSFDFDRIKAEIPEKTKLVEIQRSRGYEARPSYSVDELGELIEFIRKLRPDVTIMVDNCYGEFTETKEPSEVGADMVVGSLIKNPGGGIAPVGGYIVGKERCVELAAARLTAPGLKRELGPSLGNNRPLFMGLFQAPIVTAAAVKGAVLLSCVYEKLGYNVSPRYNETRHDIIQLIDLKSREKLIAFCQGIQKASPVDSMFMPEPDAMPGYDCDIIMAAGTFTSGSSIELSADGPLRDPYRVFYQGGINYPHAKLGVMKSVENLMNL
ncbi:MAG: methionine gamma-lyase family protein [Eubacteriales bacterium]|nr:methionine gamma-lyase family protein [Eubacteriales bacterium]